MKNTNISLFFLLFFLSFITSLLAQNKVIDSLENELKVHQKRDTIRVSTLNYLAFYNYRNNPPKAIAYIEEALKIGNELQAENFIAKSHYIKAVVYTEQADFKVAIDNFDQAILLYISLKDSTNLAKCKNGLGVLHSYQGDMKQALKYYEESLAIKENLGIKKGLDASLYNIGIVYSDMGDYKKALFNFNKALLINRKENDSLGILNNLNSIASVHYEQGNFPLSINYHNQSLQVAKKSKDSIGIFQSYINFGNVYRQQYLNDKALDYYNKAAAISNAQYNVKNITALKNNIAGIYYDKEEYDKAVILFNESIALSKKIDDNVNLATALNGLGFIYFETKYFPKALHYFKEGLKINLITEHSFDLSDSYQGLAETYYGMHKYDLALENAQKLANLSDKYELLRHKNNAYNLLSRIYDKTGNYKKAFESHQEFKLLNDSLFNKEKVEKIAHLEAEYKYKQKIDSASIRELKLTKTVTATSQDLEKTKQNYLWAIIAILFISLLLGGIIFFLKLRNIRSKTQNIIVEQKLLRSQMTPHFIFNSLSVLQGMILNQENKKSVLYLSKFSKLLRIILENSRDKTVSLCQELTAVENYLSLQNLENNSYNYSVTVDDSVEREKFKIPPMLIQPFIENAIEHAFVNQIKNRIIDVHLNYQKNKLNCTITDNGIGINVHSEKINKNKKSLSTTITSERLNILSKDYDMEGSIKIENRNIYNEQGTIVTLVIPHKIEAE